MLAYLLGSALLLGMPGGPGGPGGPNGDFFAGERGKRMAQELNLNDDQLDQIQKIREQHQSEMKERKGKMHTARTALRQAMAEPDKSSAHTKKLRELFNKVSALGQDLKKERFEMALKIRALLEPEQIAQFHSMKKKIKKRMHRKQQRGRHGKGPGMH